MVALAVLHVLIEDRGEATDERPPGLRDLRLFTDKLDQPVGDEHLMLASVQARAAPKWSLIPYQAITAGRNHGLPE